MPSSLSSRRHLAPYLEQKNPPAKPSSTDPYIDLRPLPWRVDRQLSTPRIRPRRRPRRVLARCLLRSGLARPSPPLHSNLPDSSARADTLPRDMCRAPSRHTRHGHGEQRPVFRTRPMATVFLLRNPGSGFGGFSRFECLCLGDGAAIWQPAPVQQRYGVRGLWR